MGKISSKLFIITCLFSSSLFLKADEARIAEVFGEPIGPGQRIVSISEEARAEIDALNPGNAPMERRKKSALMVIAQSFVNSDAFGASKRLDASEWAAISKAARALDGAALFRNPDGSVVNNLDYENFLVQYKKAVANFQNNEAFSKWAMSKQESSGRSGEKFYTTTAVAKYFTDKMNIDCAKGTAEKAEDLRLSVELSKLLNDKKGVLLQELNRNPELNFTLAEDFVEIANDSGIRLTEEKSLELSEKAKSAFNIYLHLMEQALENGYLVRDKELGSKVVNNGVTSRESKFAKLSQESRVELLNIAFRLSDAKVSPEQVSSEYTRFLERSRSANDLRIAQDNMPSVYEGFIKQVSEKLNVAIGGNKAQPAAHIK